MAHKLRRFFKGRSDSAPFPATVDVETTANGTRQTWLGRIHARWAALIYIMMIGLAQIMFIEMYCRWHGAYFISLPNPLRFYDPANIDKLANLTFVKMVDGVPTTMSIAAEVMAWSSVGVWAQRMYGMARRYQRQTPNLPYDMAVYIGILARNTSIAATIIIVLRLTKFSVFDVSLDRFDATVGLSFMLGFFGSDAYRFLCRLRDRLLTPPLPPESRPTDPTQ